MPNPEERRRLWRVQWNLKNKERIRAQRKAWWERNREKQLEISRRWKLLNPERVKETVRIYALKNRAKIAAQKRSNPTVAAKAKRYYQKNKIKCHARAAVNRAIKAGKMKRENCFCGEPAEAHHEDYSKPLEVMWLCIKHHWEHHSMSKETIRQL